MGASILSPVHLALVLVVVLLVFGARRHPELGKSLGASMREFKDSFDGAGSQSRWSQAPQLPRESTPVAGEEARHQASAGP
jgi:sec-independent protein translocase protein TatA